MSSRTQDLLLLGELLHLHNIVIEALYSLMCKTMLKYPLFPRDGPRDWCGDCFTQNGQ